MIPTIEPTVASPVHFGQPFQVPPQFYGYTFPSWNFPAVTMPGQFPAPRAVVERKTLDVLQEMLLSKRGANRREIYIKSLRWHLTHFAEKNPIITTITTADIESFLSKHQNVRYRMTWLNRINTLFSFALKREHVDKNPCDKIERPTIEHRVPRILTPAEAATVYRACPSVGRAWVALCLWCGLRPSEAQLINWEDINLERGTVTVRISKVRRFRIVTMPARAVELLRPLVKSSGPIAPHPTTVRRSLHRMRSALKVDRWPQDIMRHTAASYHLALTGDASKVATMLGNSPQILLTHYNGVASLDDANEFFKVTPPPPPPKAATGRKFDYNAVIAFYEGCKSYKKTRAELGISNPSTLHYILHTRKQNAPKP